MQIKEKVVRKFLSKKIQQLNNIVADLDSLVTEIGSDYFRVSIFGSARIKANTNECGALGDALLARKADGEEQHCKTNRIIENTQIQLSLQRTTLAATEK